jgi:hypothetical protein
MNWLVRQSMTMLNEQVEVMVYDLAPMVYKMEEEDPVLVLYAVDEDGEDEGEM